MAYSKFFKVLKEKFSGFKIYFKSLLNLSYQEKNESLIGELSSDTHEIMESIFISELFRRKSSVNIKKDPKPFKIVERSVVDFLDPVVKREEELKNPIPLIDSRIWLCFKGKIVLGIIKDFSFMIYRFITIVTREEIFDEAEKLKIKKVYSYFEALSMVRELIFNGVVDEEGTGIIVYFSIKGVDLTHRFEVYRYKSCLRILLRDVNYLSVWGYKDGVCFD